MGRFLKHLIEKNEKNRSQCIKMLEGFISHYSGLDNTNKMQCGYNIRQKIFELFYLSTSIYGCRSYFYSLEGDQASKGVQVANFIEMKTANWSLKHCAKSLLQKVMERQV